LTLSEGMIILVNEANESLSSNISNIRDVETSSKEIENKSR